MITGSSVLSHHPDAAAVAVGDEQVVVPGVGTIHVLEPIPALLWRCLDGNSRLDEITADFADQFDVAADEALDQFTSLVSRWRDAGLVAESGDATVVAGTAGWRRLPAAPDP